MVLGAPRDGDGVQIQKVLQLWNTIVERIFQLWNTIVERIFQLWYSIVEGPILVFQLWYSIVEGLFGRGHRFRHEALVHPLFFVFVYVDRLIDYTFK